MRRKILALGGVVALALGSCSSRAHDATPTTTSPTTTTPPTPSTTAAPSPDVLPVITVAYVNAVFAVLNHIDGNATRALAARRWCLPTVKADIRSIYNDPLYTDELVMATDSLKVPINNVRPGAERTE